VKLKTEITLSSVLAAAVTCKDRKYLQAAFVPDAARNFQTTPSFAAIAA